MANFDYGNFYGNNEVACQPRDAAWHQIILKRFFIIYVRSIRLLSILSATAVTRNHGLCLQRFVRVFVWRAITLFCWNRIIHYTGHFSYPFLRRACPCRLASVGIHSAIRKMRIRLISQNHTRTLISPWVLNTKSPKPMDEYFVSRLN